MEKELFKNTGRNDPCPCGSGKKFKKCCIEKTKRGFTAKILKSGSGLGLRSLMGAAAKQIQSDVKDFEEKQREKEEKLSSSADLPNSNDA